MTYNVWRHNRRKREKANEATEHPCRSLGHLPMSPDGGECARCGDPVFTLPDGTPWPPAPREQTQ